MKKPLFPLIALILCFAVGCGKTTVREIDDGTDIVFTAASSVLETGGNTTLEDYIVALRDKGDLTFEGENSGFGLFITSMNGKANTVLSSTANSSEGYSWAVYTDFTSFGGVIYAGDSETAVYKGKTLYKAIYGVSAIPCFENHTYAFVYEYYNFTW